jgi:hypothetical protein
MTKEDFATWEMSINQKYGIPLNDMSKHNDIEDSNEIVVCNVKNIQILDEDDGYTD